MTTVMSWRNSEGTQGRCDGRCHNATSDPTKCKCMCGGRYHGAARREGGVEAVQREQGREILEAAQAKAAAEGFELEAPEGSLFSQLAAAVEPRP